MADMMQQARERHEQIKQEISLRESEIETLREEAEKLEQFVMLAKELFAPKTDKAPEQPQKPEAASAEPQTEAAETQPRPDAPPRVMPIRQPQSA